MRLTFAPAVLGLVFLSAVFAFAIPSQAQLMKPGDPGDPTEKKPPQMQEFDDAVKFFQRGDLDNTKKSLAAAREKNADLPPPELLLAQMFAQAKMSQYFLATLEEAVQKNPTDPEAYVWLGEIGLNQARVAEADLLFAKAVALMGNLKSAERKNQLTPRIYDGLARIAEVREDWPLVQQNLDSYLKSEAKKDRKARGLVRLAKSLFQQKKAQEALEKLRDAKKADADNVPTPEAQLAYFYLQFNDPTNAKKWVEEALKVAPKDLNTRLIAGNIYLQLGQKSDLEAAKAQATEAQKIDAKSAPARMLRGLVALFQKDYSEAASKFEQIVIETPNDFQASNNLALALVESNEDSKKTRALQYAEENVKKTQAMVNSQSGQNAQNVRNAVEALSTLGWVKFKIAPEKNLDEADKLLGQAIKSNAYNTDTAFYAAAVAVASKRPEEAKALLNRAMKSTDSWTMKTDAKALLEQLNKE
jgi:tetratricopeptide (TPR) repeat protein